MIGFFVGCVLGLLIVHLIHTLINKSKTMSALPTNQSVPTITSTSGQYLTAGSNSPAWAVGPSYTTTPAFNTPFYGGWQTIPEPKTKEDYWKEFNEARFDAKRLNLILTLFKDGKIDQEECIDLLKTDKQFNKPE